MINSPTTIDLPTRDEAERLGVLADSHDQYDLMRAIQRCDELVGQLRAVQIMHSQDLCRVANHLAADLGVAREDAETSAEQVARYIAHHGVPTCPGGYPAGSGAVQ